MRRWLSAVVIAVPVLLSGGLFARGVAELALHASVPADVAMVFAPKPAAASTGEKGSLVKAIERTEVDTPKVTVADPVPCAMPGRVVATVVDPSAPSRSFAVVAMASGKGWVQPGGALQGRPVVAITGSRVWLGGRSLCWLDEKEHASEPKKDGTPMIAAPMPKGIEKVDDTHVRLDRAMRDHLFETGGADLAKSLRFTPVVSDAKIVGMKLQSVQPDSLIAKLGLRAGDELRSVNGMPLGGPEQMLELYAKLRTSPHLDFEIVRGGQKTVINVEVT
jgi:type II secretion system protein C